MSHKSGYLLIIISGMVIIGWSLDIAALKSIIPGLATMKFNTSLAFLLGGISLILFKTSSQKKHASLNIYIGIIIFFIGFLTINEYLFNKDFGIDELIIKDLSQENLIYHIPGRMSFATAICDIIMGLSLLFAGLRKNIPFLISVLLLIIICFFDLMGYLYNYQQLYELFAFSSMAVHTAFAFLIFSVGVSSAYPQPIITRILNSNYPGIVMTRRLMIPVIAVTIIVGGLITNGEDNLSGNEIEIAILVTFVILLSVAAFWYTAHLLNSVYVELHDLNKSLEKRVAERTKDLESFSYSVSHDLRAPLRAIKGYTKMLKENHGKSLDNEGHRIIDIVQNSAKKMGSLIDNLLALSKLGRKEVRKSFVDMTQLAKTALQEINKTIAHKAEVNIYNLHPVMADQVLMSQVLTNLLSNAIKYSSKKQKPVIEIKSENKNGELIYSVTDNGVGFDMENADMLFDVFQRLHTEKEFEGIGVGLAIVHLIIEKHGGKIWAEGKPDEGASFYFSLPVNQTAKNLSYNI